MLQVLVESLFICFLFNEIDFYLGIGEKDCHNFACKLSEPVLPCPTIKTLTEHMLDIIHIIAVVLFLCWYANCQHGTHTLQHLSLNDRERERERARGDFEKLKISVSPYAQNFEAFPPTWHFKVAQPLWKDAGGPMFEVDDKDVYN